MALPKGVKSPVDYTKLFLSQELEGEILDEKALSKSQQRFMGMVYAYKKGEMPNASDEVKKAAEGMSKKDAEKYASTKHAKLPEKVEPEKKQEDEKEPSNKTLMKVKMKGNHYFVYKEDYHIQDVYEYNEEKRTDKIVGKRTRVNGKWSWKLF